MDIKTTLLLRLNSLLRCPVVAFLGVTVEQLDARVCKVRVPYGFRSKNPMKGMFLGALTTGADVAGSLAAYSVVRTQKANVSIVFKSMQAEFLKRATEDVTFVCAEVPRIEAAVKSTIATGEPVEIPVPVQAFVKSRPDSEPVARFTLALSVKSRAK